MTLIEIFVQEQWGDGVLSGNFSAFIQLSFAINTGFSALHMSTVARLGAKFQAHAKRVKQVILTASPLEDNLDNLLELSDDEALNIIRSKVEKDLKYERQFMVYAAILSAAWLFLIDFFPNFCWTEVGNFSFILCIPFCLYWRKWRNVNKEIENLVNEAENVLTMHEKGQKKWGVNSLEQLDRQVGGYESTSSAYSQTTDVKKDGVQREEVASPDRMRRYMEAEKEVIRARESQKDLNEALQRLKAELVDVVNILSSIPALKTSKNRSRQRRRNRSNSESSK